jgi:TetR/AcrR family transcriptional regulator, fatty acid biosynthesis regulator
MTATAKIAPIPKPAARKRTRKPPEERRAEILDSAAGIILEEGLSAVSMEGIAREISISKALVYNYFSSRDQLFAALLEREQTELRERGMGAAMQAESFVELIRQTTRLYLEQVQSRGSLIAALLSDPSVAKLMEKRSSEDRDRARRYFIKQVVQNYQLSTAMASASVDLLWTITDGAGRLLSQGDLDIDTAEEMCVQLITGGLDRLSRKFKR